MIISTLLFFLNSKYRKVARKKAGEASAKRFKSSKPDDIVETQLDISPIQLGDNT
jgi:hypothetical protein